MPRFGLGRATMFLARRIPGFQAVPVHMDDGRVIVLDLREIQNMPYLFGGRAPYEFGEEQVVRELVRPGEAAVDVGANVGWYSTMLATLVGPGGRVYAFEPNQRVVRTLQKTASWYPNLSVVEAAVADREGEEILHVSRELGNSSLMGSAVDEIGAQPCRVTTLDHYLTQRNERDVTFLKSDTEGAELRVLAGAKMLLGGPRPPACLLEVNARYGLVASRLLQVFASLSSAEYRAWAINSISGRLTPPIFNAGVTTALFVPGWMRDRIAAREPRD